MATIKAFSVLLLGLLIVNSALAASGAGRDRPGQASRASCRHWKDMCGRFAPCCGGLACIRDRNLGIYRCLRPLPLVK
jgi:hypothetical protein